ncbi:hypothetical protein AM363_09075 [Citrobacter freundii]|uniref:Uncharacterized protein n=1 Tax=Citrobacter freundii TaxID=546 RepID=A0AB33H1K4_CITFR|nr:hypothetical protein [Citrobacter freundii]AXZ47096.1 hypothetical protein AM363_09075 [Citrobacter freundii]
MKQQPLSTACNYGEACEMLRSGYVKHVRLSWNVGSDEFFRIASDWCDAGAKIKKDGVDSICQRNTPFNYLFRCFELQCLSWPVV